ncbi:MAG: hypothetical protein V4671_18970 [Armatimonadota bacterium]
MKLPEKVSGAFRTFAYFLSSGTHFMLEGVDYLDVYGNEPSAIEQTFAIFANVLEYNDQGEVTNLKHAEKRATDYLRSYCDRDYRVEPPFEGWEVALH